MGVKPPYADRFQVYSYLAAIAAEGGVKVTLYIASDSFSGH